MLASNVEKLLKALHDEGVEFVIIGGAAAVLHGSAYVTGDLDICYSRERENLKKVATALIPFNPSLRGAPKNLPFQLDAFSGPFRPLIPADSGHPFQSNPATVPGIPATPLLGA